jgi:outer membrane protein assembly factor BamB
MSDSTMVPEADAVPRSGWRRAVVAFVALGAALYGFGRLAFRMDEMPVPVPVVILCTMLGPLLALMGFGLWWLVFGDFAKWVRLLSVVGGVALAVGVFFAAEGEMGPQPRGMKTFSVVWGVPLAAAVTGLALVFVPALRGWPAALVAVAAIAPWLALRVEGVSGSFALDVSPRWAPSQSQVAEQKLAEKATVTPAAPVAAVTTSAADWPGFRGADRTGIAPADAVRGWDGTAPREKWRKDPIGPAWSSFAAAGDLLFTQEQRGESESVVCYKAETGDEVWARGEPGRHTDWASASGPRATPTLAGGRLFAVTGTGVVLALKPESGEVLWKVDLKERFAAGKPQFGFSTSPLVVGEVVYVNPAAPDAPRLVALDAATGATKWQAEGKGTDGYSSPQAATIAGAPQMLVFNGKGLFGHDPLTGKELWHYDWVTQVNEPTTVQPLVLPDGRVLIGGGNKGLGLRCVAVKRDGDNWSAAEAWKTTRFTPVFNDVVRVGENLFGLDAGRLACVDLADGKVRWKEGNYGAGQVLLVGDKILVVAESGQLACVAANPAEYEELWKVDAVKGKTWNHPAVARGRLFVRNATQMAAFELPGASAAGK